MITTKEQAGIVFQKMKYAIASKKMNPNDLSLTEIQQIKDCAIIYCDGMEEERRRAVDIAYEFSKKALENFEAKKKAGGPLAEIAFAKEEVAEECRYVGNAISGKNALNMNDKSYWERVKDEIKTI